MWFFFCLLCVTVLGNKVVSRNIVNKTILIICWHIFKEFTCKSIFTKTLSYVHPIQEEKPNHTCEVKQHII